MFKPMLAPNDDPLKNINFFKEMKYPLSCSPKLDGIRCIVKDGMCRSRSFKPLPSLQVQEVFSGFAELDGELIIGNETDFDVYNRTQSHVMSEDKPHIGLKFRVFDCALESIALEPFEDRLAHARELVEEYNEVFNPPNEVSLVEHTLVTCYDELIEFETKMLEQGYEGIMMRDPFGKYKHGRGTFKEGLIYKLKRFQDDEAVLIDVVEQQLNVNTLEKDELGYAKRSTAKDGMVGADTCGKLIVNYNQQILDVSCGCLDHEERKHIWENPQKYLGRLIKFRFFNHGIKDKPRFPRFSGWRDLMDVSEK